MTKYTSPTCEDCGTTKIALDDHYNLNKCYDFILVCPNHPAKVTFDLPEEEIFEIANS